MAKRKNIWPFGKGQPLGERTTYRRTRTVAPSRTKAAPRVSKAVAERESKRSESERLEGKLTDADLKGKLQRHYAKGGTLSEYLAANPAHAARIRRIAAASAKSRNPGSMTAAQMMRSPHGYSGNDAILEDGSRWQWRGDLNAWVRVKAASRAASGPVSYNLSEKFEGRGLEDPFGDLGKKFGKHNAPKRRRANPAAGAAEVFEEFHGTPSKELVAVKSRVHFHEHLAALGKLAYLKIAGVDGYEHTIKDFGGALLCSNEERNQLFIEGGDQAIDLKVFGIKSAHELESLGAVTEIGYRTTKHHLGAEGGKALYFHETGEEGGRAPDLVYRTRDERLEIVGGSYTIEAEGIKN